VDLKAIYLTALERCAPELLVRSRVTTDMPRNVIAIGKCAGALLDGVAAVHDVEHAFVALPEGYRRPTVPAEVHLGGHPQMTRASFEAGRALLDFVNRHDDILFLISGGGSACVEVPLPPHGEAELIETNARLIAGGLPIGAINARRRALSAIKGGRLGARVRGRAVALIYSDVARGKLDDVASGPVANGILIADNSTLVRAAADIIGTKAVVIDEQLEGDVDEVARTLASTPLAHEQILVSGGEPTVVVRGDGRGGRCTELAVRFAMRSTAEALFASSDGVDGNSGVAGIHLPPRSALGNEAAWNAELAVSNSYRIAAQVGEPIMIAPTGNNLRDLFLVRAI
jgi:glycerate 2-kinase